MTIEALMKVVPPPAEPFEAYRGPWGPIEAEIGTALPADYKDFVGLYGCGSFMEFLGVHVPQSSSPYVRLVSEVHAVRKIFADDEDVPYPLWPDPGGLLPFGKTDFGDYLFWLARGAPEEWPIVVWGRGHQEFEVFDCGLTDFLAGVALGEIDPKDFPEGECECLFEPSLPRRGGPRLPATAASGAKASIGLSWRFGRYGTGWSGISTSQVRGDA